MNTPMNKLLCFFISLFTSSVFCQIPTLTIPNSLINSSSPSISATVNYNVEMRLEECIELLGSVPGSPGKVLSLGNNPMAEGQTTSILCVAKLNDVSESSGAMRYNFSPGCAENNKTSASVRIMFGNTPPEEPTDTGPATIFNIQIDDSECLIVSGNESPVGPTNNKTWLRINASRQSTAIITINEDTNRGHCLVAIIDADGEGKTIAVLDPKSENALSFTTDRQVYIIPIIKPKAVKEAGKNVLLYEIGDPKRNGKVKVEEAG